MMLLLLTWTTLISSLIYKSDMNHLLLYSIQFIMIMLCLIGHLLGGKYRLWLTPACSIGQLALLVTLLISMILLSEGIMPPLEHLCESAAPTPEAACANQPSNPPIHPLIYSY